MRRKFYLLAVIAIFAFIGFVSTDSSDAYVCGDANGDGLLNVSDAVFIINYVFVGGPAPDPYCCDICPPTVTDYDGNIYETVLIGDQCWMKENLKVIHYRNGDLIPNVTDDGEWLDLETGAYCNYSNDDGYVAEYGRLYNWYAATDIRGIAPVGWHVPSDAELKSLEMYLGMSQADADMEGWRGTDEGGKLKETGTVHWLSPNTGATNESGFTALPGGARVNLGYFQSMGYSAVFWSSTSSLSDYAWTRYLFWNRPDIHRNDSPMLEGFSVRCVKD